MAPSQIKSLLAHATCTCPLVLPLQCGTGTVDLAPVTEPTPLIATGMTEYVSFNQVVTGDRFTCAHSTIGEIYCFGGCVAKMRREWLPKLMRCTTLCLAFYLAEY